MIHMIQELFGQTLRPSSTNGLRSSDGRLVRTARSHILPDFADTRARRKPLKPLRGESRVISGVLVVTTVCLLPMHTGCGCSGHPAFPAPSVFEGQSFWQTSGGPRRETKSPVVTAR